MTEFTGGRDLTLSLQLLWGRKQPPSRGPKRTLTLDEIAAAGVKIADAEGLAGLSMRRLAEDLGVGTMSLYRYVEGKSELIVLMLDRVLYRVETSEDFGRLGWRAAMEAFAQDLWRLQHEHPWLLQVSDARPLLGPNSLAGTEQMLAALVDTGLSELHKVQVINLVYSYVLGAARVSVEAAQAAARTGVSDEEFWAAQAPFLEEVLTDGSFPHLTKAMDAKVWDNAVNPDNGFDFGLQLLLNGVDQLISGQDAPRESPDE